MATAALTDAFEAAQLQSFQRRTEDVDLATARQRDGAAYDMRQLGAFISSALFASDDPEMNSRLNVSSRIPTTLDQPGAIVTK